MELTVKEKTVSEFGYAKINLHLDVTGRMEGGYHRVATVMQTLSLYDTVTLTQSEGEGFTLSCNVAGVPTDASNLAVRAAVLFCERVGMRLGAHIAINKRIPMAAGLAGGSADAAATLIAMNRLAGEPLSREALCALAARLGADVPFCVDGGTAYGDGRGDRLTALSPMPDCFVAVACGGEGVSTPWAYGLLDRLYDDFSEKSFYEPCPTEGLLEALEKGNLDLLSERIYNIFEAPVLAERPVARQIREQMLASGAIGAMMSGSGPSVFGVFRKEREALDAVRALTESGVFACVCKPIARKW